MSGLIKLMSDHESIARANLMAEMMSAPKMGLIDLCRLGEGGTIIFNKSHYQADRYFAERKVVDGQEVFGSALSQDEIYQKVSEKIKRMIGCANGEIEVTQDIVDELIYPISQHFLAEVEARRLEDPSLLGYVSDQSCEYPQEVQFSIENGKHFTTRKVERKRMVHLKDLTQGVENPRSKELRLEVCTYQDLVTRKVGFIVSYQVDSVKKAWLSVNPCSQN